MENNNLLDKKSVEEIEQIVRYLEALLYDWRDEAPSMEWQEAFVSYFTQIENILVSKGEK